MKRFGLFAAAVAGAALVVSGVSLAQGRDDDDDNHGSASATLSGYQETPQSISTRARGSFEARIEDGSITFRLRYENLEGGTKADAAHVHFGQRHTSGGVSAFLCGGSTKPACPDGTGATVEGTITSADVIGPATQGIDPGQLDELVAAIRAGAAYANVHTAKYPSGEIRGQLRGKRGRSGGDDD